MRVLSVDLMPEPRISKWEGVIGLASGLSCESYSPDVSVLPRCVIAGYFCGPGTFARAWHGVVVPNAHATGGANARRE